MEKYFHISDRFYFAPSAGIGPTLVFFDKFEFNHFGWMATAQPSFSYFFNNTHISAGASFFIFDFFTEHTNITTSSNLFLSGEFFIAEKLSIKPVIYRKLHGDGGFFFYYQNGRFVSVDKFHLQFGFSYYY